MNRARQSKRQINFHFLLTSSSNCSRVWQSSFVLLTPTFHKFELRILNKCQSRCNWLLSFSCMNDLMRHFLNKKKMLQSSHRLKDYYIVKIVTKWLLEPVMCVALILWRQSLLRPLHASTWYWDLCRSQTYPADRFYVLKYH